jgi:hypothetical protein
VTVFAPDAKDNLVLIAIFLIAFAQALTILLTARRERDVKELRELFNELSELFNEQRLQIVKLKAWLAGRNAAQLGRMKSERESKSEPLASNVEVSEPALASKDSAETIQPPVTEDQAAQFGNADSDASSPAGLTQMPLEEIRRLRARLSGAPATPMEPAMPSEPESGTTQNDLRDAVQSSTTETELERATKAIDWLKEDADKARENVVKIHGTPPAKKI